MWIVIEDGDVFAGTVEHFSDCFFVPGDDPVAEIRLFCLSQSWRVRFFASEFGPEVV